MSSSTKKPSVLISGSSSGIGEAAAILLGEKGWTVFAGVRKQADAEKLRSYSGNIHPVILDVTKEDQVREAIEQVRVAVGEDGLDALINNAGVAYSGPTEFISMENVQRQFDVNLFGFFRLTQAAMPLIRMGKPGRVINVSTIGAQQVCPFLGMYEGSKAALETISQAFRQELARWGIPVVLIRPGPVNSKFDSAVFADYDEYMKELSPGSSAHDFYGKDLENIREVAKKLKKHSVESKVVAEVIHQALTARNPKPMYYDSWRSYLTTQVYSWMPTSWFDAMIRRLFTAKN